MPRHPGNWGALGMRFPEVGMSYNRAALLLRPKPETAVAITGGQTRFRRNGCIICIVCLHKVKGSGSLFPYFSGPLRNRLNIGPPRSTLSSGSRRWSCTKISRYGTNGLHRFSDTTSLWRIDPQLGCIPNSGRNSMQPWNKSVRPAAHQLTTLLRS
jgi:hypothetical protein